MIKSAALDCEAMAIDEFTHKYPSQVALLGIQFIWTLDSEVALYRSKSEKGVMNSMNRKNLQRLNDLIAINLKSEKDLAECESMLCAAWPVGQCFQFMAQGIEGLACMVRPMAVANGMVKVYDADGVRVRPKARAEARARAWARVSVTATATVTVS